MEINTEQYRYAIGSLRRCALKSGNDMGYEIEVPSLQVKVSHLTAGGLEEILNTLGADGWEFAVPNLPTLIKEDVGTESNFILKRSYREVPKLGDATKLPPRPASDGRLRNPIYTSDQREAPRSSCKEA